MGMIYHTAATLDGFIATSDHSLQWLFDVPGAAEAEATMEAFTAGVGALVMGASTYEWLIESDHMCDNPDAWEQAYGHLPTWVLTHRRLPALGSRVRLASGDVADLAPDIERSADGKNVWIMGGGPVAAQFVRAGLLDQMVVTIAPVTLGQGQPLLPTQLLSDRLTLESVEQVGQFAQLHYGLRSPD